MGNMGASITQKYFGRTIFMHSNVDTVRAREVLARNHGFTMVPPEDMDVIDENTDTSVFVRFTYDNVCVSYMDIINNLVSYVDDNLVYYNKDFETLWDASKEQLNYIKEHYGEELEAKLKSLESGVTETVEQAVEPSQESTGEQSITIQDLVTDENRPAANPVNNTAPDVSKTHIPDDDFMQTPTPNRPLNVTVAPEEQTVNPLEHVTRPYYQMPDISADVYARFPYLRDLGAKITANGGFKVSYEWHCGLLEVKVAPTDKPSEVMDKYSLTIDPFGYVIDSTVKWWPGVDHKDPVDFQKAYVYDLNAIDVYLSGEEIPAQYVRFDDKILKLNKTVELRTACGINGISMEETQALFTKIDDAINKLSSRLAKEYPKARFRLTKYTDKDNFELEAGPEMYEYIGGNVVNVPIEGAAVKIQVASKKAPKLEIVDAAGLLRSHEMKVLKFKTIINDLYSKLGGNTHYIDEKGTHPVKTLLNVGNNNPFINCVVDLKATRACGKPRANGIEGVIKEGRYVCGECHSFGHGATVGGQTILFALMVLAIDNDLYNQKIEIVSDAAYLMGFTEDMIEDWTIAVKKILSTEKIDSAEMKTKEAKDFFGHLN